MAVKYFDMACFPVRCCFAMDEKSFHKEMKQLKVVGSEEFVAEGAIATVRMFDNPVLHPLIMVCIDLKRAKKLFNPSGLKGVLLHEAVHVWQDVRETMGERSPAIETEAYFIQWMSKELWKAAGIF